MSGSDARLTQRPVTPLSLPNRQGGAATGSQRQIQQQVEGLWASGADPLEVQGAHFGLVQQAIEILSHEPPNMLCWLRWGGDREPGRLFDKTKTAVVHSTYIFQKTWFSPPFVRVRARMRPQHCEALKL